MPVHNENQKHSLIVAFVDYIPAELRVNSDWLIVYYAKNPITEKLERQRVRVPKIKSTSERTRFARKMVAEINSKLLSGWSPFINSAGKNFKGWNDALTDFENYLKKQLDDKALRPDSCRTYFSNLSLIREFINEKKIKIVFALEFNRSFCWQYLDWVYMERKNSARTRNNHLIFLRLLANYFLQRGILAENPTTGIKNLPKETKKRIYIPVDIREKIKTEVLQWDNGFDCLCETIYHCFIRNSELRKMRVGFVNLERDVIFIPKTISKNKKDEFVTIPESFKSTIAKHIINANENDFLFSDNFMPGSKQIGIRKIQSYWDKLRKKIGLLPEHHFYGLKDTGITDLFLKGIPAIKIRDQARHSSVLITELYTPRNMGCDEMIKNAGNIF
jgi:integrase/recombinase XerD